MKKIKHLMIWIGLLLSLVSCRDTMEAIGLGGEEIPAEGVVLNVQLTNFSERQIGSRAGEAVEKIQSLWIVFYDANNQYLDKADYTSYLTSSNQQADGSFAIKITHVPTAAKYVHLVANASDMTDDEAKNLQDLSVAEERTPNLDAPICWGVISVDNLLAGGNQAQVNLYRQCAKISLQVDKSIQNDFTSAGLDVYSTATKAAIAPVNYKEPTSDELAESTNLRNDESPLGGGTASIVAVNETSAGKAVVIVKAKYKNQEGYYKVALYKDNNKTDEYALLRNHNYTIRIIKVNDYGFKTEDEAMKSLPENRLEVEIVDDNPEITKMIACKDYELGVSDYQEVGASATEAIVTVVTNLQNATCSDGSLYQVNIKDSWITGCSQIAEVATPETGRLSTTGKKYTLRFTLNKNDKSEDPRTGTITITSGDLSLDVTIKQAGFDFRREDPNRKVSLVRENITVANDYFKWLDDEVQGIKPAEMQGVVRNEGLHFTVGTNGNSYLIPKLTGDQVTNNDNRFTVQEENGNWKITLNDNHAKNFDLWTSKFIIKNQEGIDITYNVYHTGIFHLIETSSDAYTKYQLTEDGNPDKKVKGWFYYGVVKVAGQKKQYIMLDRNLGASNNGFYTPDVTALRDNEKAIGGYFYISESKNTSDATQGNLSSVLAPSGYTIPSDDVFEDLEVAGSLNVISLSTSLGETYNCVRIQTVDSELKYIYLPVSGYLEGESLKNPIHVNLWTKTLLAGTQGFSVDSPEYGYWYRYFDIYNKQIGLSNMRFVSGSNGKNNGRYKAMPIRLIAAE